ncbi:MAG: hypothetical protein IIC27_04040, partial [Chloroflexi bacterium]|nr:hypothetical protein [Chloroflexota bacterium]
MSSSPSKVGEVSPSDIALFSIHHPMMESFTELAFRPQLMLHGALSFVHNPRASSDAAERDEAVRPQVLVQRSWGAQDSSGWWAYVADPEDSRARGGTANGGILYTPPEFEMEDYLQINSQVNVKAPTTTSYVMVTPGIGYALGTPNSDGGLNVKSITIAQDTDSNEALLISQLKSDRSSVSLIRAELDQSSGEIVVSVGTDGNQAIRIPRGTTAQRQSAISPGGGELRISTNVVANQDLLEFFDSQTTTWEHHNTASRMASTGTGEGASLVGVEDSAANFTATTVEGVLAEIGSGGGSTTFTALTDTPANFSGAGSKAVKVNSGATVLEFIDLDTLYRTQTVLASVNNAEGASLVGIEDSASIYTATEVEAALAEVKVIADAASTVTDHGALTGLGDNDHPHYSLVADIASTSTGKGASLVGLEDSASIYTATEVEAALAEVRVVADAAMPLAGGTVTGDVVLDDNVELQLGTYSAEVEIFSDGTGMIVG